MAHFLINSRLVDYIILISQMTPQRTRESGQLASIMFSGFLRQTRNRLAIDT